MPSVAEPEFGRVAYRGRPARPARYTVWKNVEQMKDHTFRDPDSVFRECRLCRVPSQLEHSHIISRLMFRPMGRLASGTPIRVDSLGGTSRPGHLKEYMLCPSCEDQFSAHERIAARFLADLNQYQPRAHERSIRKSSLDYASLKLFFLSLLWRCAVARDPITRATDLGPRLSKLTELLQANDPGAQEEFAVLVRLLDEPPIERNVVLSVPVPMRDESWPLGTTNGPRRPDRSWAGYFLAGSAVTPYFA